MRKLLDLFEVIRETFNLHRYYTRSALEGSRYLPFWTDWGVIRRSSVATLFRNDEVVNPTRCSLWDWTSDGTWISTRFEVGNEVGVPLDIATARLCHSYWKGIPTIDTFRPCYPQLIVISTVFIPNSSLSLASITEYWHDSLLSSTFCYLLTYISINKLLMEIPIIHREHTNSMQNTRMLSTIATTIANITVGRPMTAYDTVEMALDPVGPPGLLGFRFMLHFGLTYMDFRRERWKPTCSHRWLSSPASYCAALPRFRINDIG